MGARTRHAIAGATALAYLILPAAACAGAIAPSAERQVRAILRDPNSARFDKATGRVLLTLDNGAHRSIDCGHVNAKNGYGGYTGQQPWFVVTFEDGSSGACVGAPEPCPLLLDADMIKAAKTCLDAAR